MKLKKAKASAALGVALIAVGATGAGVAQATTIRIVGTSDLFDSNFFQNQISPGFLASPFAEAGDTLTYDAVGTGKALSLAEGGGFDVVLVHSPVLELPFVTEGYSYEPLGRGLLYNDYEIVGPTGDPANVGATDANNAIGAFEKIAAAGNAGNATFVSRNDASGTNTQEETMWGQTTGVTLQLAQNRPAGNTTLYQPAASPGVTAYPAWYALDNTANNTQGENLLATNACTGTSFSGGSGSTANGSNCYTMADDGTIKYYQYSLSNIPKLKTVVATNSATALGGTTELVNPFHAYIVNPVDPATGGTYPGGPSAQPNVKNALRLVNYMTGVSYAAGISGGGGPTGATGFTTFGPTFQLSNIPGYLRNTHAPLQPLYADALPQVTNALPGQSTDHVTSGTQVTVTATLSYAPPPSPPIASMPYEFEESTNNGSTWSVISSAGAVTDSNGNATGQTTPITGKTLIQLVTPNPFDDFAAGIRTQFSPYSDTVDFAGGITTP